MLPTPAPLVPHPEPLASPSAQEEPSELDLREFLRVIRRRRWLVLAACLATVATALGASFLRTPMYESTAHLLVQTQGQDSLFNPVTGQRIDPERAVQSEILVVKSEPVRDLVRRQLGTAPDIEAGVIAETDGIEITARDAEPRRAAEVANAYGRAYIDFRRTQGVDALLAAGKEIQAKVAELQDQVDRLNGQLDRMSPQQRVAEGQPLEATRDALLQQQALFKQKLDQLQVDTSLKGGGALLLTPAAVPGSPSSPRPVRNGISAAVVGLLLGVGLALLREHLDDSIKGKEDVDRVVGGLPVLGLIPSVRTWRDTSTPVVASLTEPTSPAAEAYRTLRTSVQFLGFERPMRLVQLTSPSSSEGKTTTLANLAVALAGAHQHVTVVCCDLRRPRIHEFFGLGNQIGFTSVLMGDRQLSDALQPVPGVPGLRLLASGPIPPNPSELLASRRAAEVLTALQSESDIVLLDCPPVLPVTDAAALSLWADAALFVVRAGATSKRDVQRAVEILLQADVPVIGTVLNSTAKEERAYYYYYRADREGHRASPPGRRASRRRRQRSDPRLSRPSAPVGPAAPGSNGAGEAQPSAAEAADHRR